MAHMFSQ